MITYKQGSLFDGSEQTIVNTVNCVGIMGKGIALEYKKRYPNMFEKYKSHCDNKIMNIGTLFLYKTPDRWILNFPTKYHWRNKSKLSYIEDGLKKFVSTYKDKGISSIAFPLLGCQNGGLDWESEVKPLMEQYLSNLDDISISIYLY
jgi:O-acetyl-ADP-ribose deacetylase (regulator of RNase III)